LSKSLANTKPDPQDLFFFITTLILEMSQGLSLTHAGLLLDWTVGAAALSGPLILIGLGKE